MSPLMEQEWIRVFISATYPHGDTTFEHKDTQHNDTQNNVTEHKGLTLDT
jgi:hypothetical protein